MAKGYLKQYLLKKGTARGTPVSGTFELTARCNLSCKMCYIHAQADDMEKRSHELSAQKWLQLGRQAVDMGMIYLLLTGGEPMLRADFAEIYEGMAKMGVILSVNTNGTYLTQDLLDLFVKYPPEKINISLYGMSGEKYGSLCRNAAGYDRAIRNILLLKNAGVTVNLNTTFTRENVEDMEKIVEFAKKESIPVRTASYLFPPVRGGEGDRDIFLSPEEQGEAAAKFDWLTLESEKLHGRATMIREALRGNSPTQATESRAAACTAGRGSFWITWDGKMSPCGMINSYEDVTGQSFSQAWANTQENIRQYLLPQDCLGCNYKAICPSCVAVFADEDENAGVLLENMCRRTKAYAAKLQDYALRTLNCMENDAE
jgi:radical SAM protein with 4Fe4S-binding SPASM domain